jgi:hypothetical protein
MRCSPWSSTEFLRQFRPSPVDHFQPSLQFPGFLVEVGQLLLEFFLLQMILPALLTDQGLDFVPQQPKPGIAVHAGFPVLQLARPHGCKDFLLGKSEFLPSGLVAEGGSLSCPY